MVTSEVLLWEKVAQNNKNRGHIDSLLGKYKSTEFKNLVQRWVGSFENKRVLKTDLREEAYGDDEVLFSLPMSDVVVIFA